MICPKCKKQSDCASTNNLLVVCEECQKKKMRKFTIPVWWEMAADVEIEAESLKEAIEKVENLDALPKNGEYIDDSFTVNVECAEELNP